MDDLREQLAEYLHDGAWSGWVMYMFGKCNLNKDGTLTIPRWAVERWQRQATTQYKALPEDEKESDRQQADKILEIINE